MTSIKLRWMDQGGSHYEAGNTRNTDGTEGCDMDEEIDQGNRTTLQGPRRSERSRQAPQRYGIVELAS